MAALFNYDKLDKNLFDLTLLSEIISLDEGDDHSFSQDIVEKWFVQADEIIPELKDLLYATPRRSEGAAAEAMCSLTTSARARLSRGPAPP